MPGGAIDAIAAARLPAYRGIFALHCDPRLEVARFAIRRDPSPRRRPYRDHAVFAGGHTSART